MYLLQTNENDEVSEVDNYLSNNLYHIFLSACFQSATMFSLSKARWTSSNCNELEADLKKWVIRSVKTKKWFGYDYTEEPDGGDSVVEAYIYEANSCSKEILLKYTDNIFLGKCVDGKFIDSCQTLEDLCFFKKNELFVGTVSHAELIKVSPINQTLKEIVCMNNRWIYLDENMDYVDFLKDITFEAQDE